MPYRRQQTSFGATYGLPSTDSFTSDRPIKLLKLLIDYVDSGDSRLPKTAYEVVPRAKGRTRASFYSSSPSIVLGVKGLRRYEDSLAVDFMDALYSNHSPSRDFVEVVASHKTDYSYCSVLNRPLKLGKAIKALTTRSKT